MLFKHTLIAALISAAVTAPAFSTTTMSNYSALADRQILARTVNSGRGHLAITPQAQADYLKTQARIASAQKSGLIASEQQVSYDKQFNSPSFVWADAASVKAPVAVVQDKQKASFAASYYLRQYAGLYGLDNALTGVYTKSVHDTGRGAIIVKLVQKMNGLDVVGAELNITMKRDYALVALSGSLSAPANSSERFLKINAKALQFQIPVRDILTGVMADMGVKSSTNSFISTGKSGRYDNYKVPHVKGDIRIPTLRSKPVYFHNGENVIPAYYVEAGIGQADSRNTQQYGYIVSAVDGKTLQRKNLTNKDGFGYRVFADSTGLKIPHDGPQGRAGHPHPTGFDNGFIPAFEAPNLVITNSGPISTLDEWLSSDASETSGNNVDAYADRSGDDGFDAEDFRADSNSVTVTGEKSFDYALNPNQFPGADSTQIKAAITNMFYVNNWLHDWFYDSGFDEAAGNGQMLNRGRGGVEGDPIHAEAQDFSDFDNANMSTPADGASPRMQMYLFYAPGDAPTIAVNTPAALGIIRGQGAAFGPYDYHVDGDLVLYVDDAGKTSEEMSDGCEAAINAEALAGKIAVMYRNDTTNRVCDFETKTYNAQVAGAIGAIILNPQSYVGREAPIMNGYMEGIDIPAVSATTESGNALRSAMNAGITNVTLASTQPTRDSSMDNLIIAHEWGHYLSNRLIGNSVGLINNQGASMGEGWSDFVALLMTVEEQDALVPANHNWSGVYAMGGYALQGTERSNTYFTGVRDWPYTTDMTKNPLTFSYVGDNAEVHGSGTLWASILWEAYAGLLQDSSRLSFRQAQQRMKDYLVASYKITPLTPTFTEARDALIAVALANDVKDAALFAKAFAKRGMGAGAVSPERYSTDHYGVVESFSAGGAATISNVSYSLLKDCDGDGVLDAGDEATLHFTVTNTGFTTLNHLGANVDTSSVTALGAATLVKTDLAFGESTTGSARVQLNANLTTGARTRIAVLPSSPDIDTAAHLPAGSVTGIFNYDLLPNASDSDNGNSGLLVDWLAGVNSDVSDPSVTTEAVASSVQFSEDNKADRVYVVWNQPVTADTSFATPQFIVGADDAFVLQWKMAWYFEYDFSNSYDGGVIEYSIDGGPWQDAGAHLTPAYSNHLSYDFNPVFSGAGRDGYLRVNPATIANGQITLEDASLNLTGMGLAGKSVQMRFRTGSDPFASGLGFVVDDIHASGANSPFSALVANSDICAAVSIAAPASALEGNSLLLNAQTNGAFSGDSTYVWQRISGPEVNIGHSHDGSVATLIAPQVNADTALVVQLTVTDSKGHSAQAQTSVMITNSPKAQDAGGGGAFYWPALLLMLGLRRRQRN